MCHSHTLHFESFNCPVALFSEWLSRFLIRVLKGLVTVEMALTSPFVMRSCLMCLRMSNWAARCFGMFLSAIICS